jgi:hypothetical protein
MFTRTRVLFVLVLLALLVLAAVLAVPSNAATAPAYVLGDQLGVFTTGQEIIMRNARCQFGLTGCTPDTTVPAGQTLPVYFIQYDDNTEIVWCYVTPNFSHMVPCGRTEVYYKAAYGALAVLPDYENTMTVTHPGTYPG